MRDRGRDANDLTLAARGRSLVPPDKLVGPSNVLEIAWPHPRHPHRVEQR